MGFYLVSVILILWFFWDGALVVWEMGVFALIYFVYLFCVKNWSQWLQYDTDDVELDESTRFLQHIHGKPYIYFFIGILVIGWLSHLMVEHGVHIAHAAGIPPVIIGLTILAAGTSMSDLFSSVVAARK